MAVEDVKQEYLTLLKSLGKAGLNAVFPNDFEYYMVAFELVDSGDRSVDYFAFPILPNNISESKPEINNIKKTAGGIVVVDNDTFIPTKISLSGTFGRGFKFLLNSRSLTFAGFSLDPEIGFEREFSSFAKTGYGCIKSIEKIKDKSRKLDLKGKPYKLMFYNPVLGNNYIVKFDDFVHSQNIDNNNMLPRYDITLTSIGEMGFSIKNGILDMAKNLSIDGVQKGINNSFSGVSRALSKITLRG